jgi:hypothetical protein
MMGNAPKPLVAYGSGRVVEEDYSPVARVVEASFRSLTNKRGSGHPDEKTTAGVAGSRIAIRLDGTTLRHTENGDYGSAVIATNVSLGKARRSIRNDTITRTSKVYRHDRDISG